MRVRKRDGRVVPFNVSKIRMCFLFVLNTFGGEAADVDSLVLAVCAKLAVVQSDLVTYAEIQDACEEVLADAGFYKVAKAWALNRRMDEDAQACVPVDGELSNYIVAAKYAREIGGFLETKSQVIARCEQMHKDKFPGLAPQIIGAFDPVRQGFVAPSMRSMQFAGPKILKHNESLYNCVGGLCDRLAFWEEEMFWLLCGAGVGASYRFGHVGQLPIVSRGKGRLVRHHVVGDTIEGWARAAGFLVRAYYAGYYPEFSYHEIRDEGMPLVVTGGAAPGHQGLKRALECGREILERARGRQLRPIECNDLSCYNSSAVLAGGVRRSSKIALFSSGDTEFLYAKAHEMFDPGGKNWQRALANNSMSISPGTDLSRIIAVAHDQFRDIGAEKLRAFCKAGGILYDVKYLLPAAVVDGRL